MKKLFLFLMFIIVLFISSCASTSKVPESGLVEESSDEGTKTPVEIAEPSIPETKPEIDAVSELAVLPDEIKEKIEEVVIEDLETVELAEETPLEPIDEELITAPVIVTEAVPEVIDKVIAEVAQETIPEIIPEVVPDVVVVEIPPQPQVAMPPQVVIPPTEAIPPQAVVPPTDIIPPVTVIPLPVDPIPEPAPSQVTQVLPPVEEEPPVVIPPPPLFETTGPLPALSGQYEETELLPGTFSRIVQAVTGQLVEIPFSGNGWLYLGEAESRKGIVYDSRRVDPEGQSFIFRAEAPGVYALKFYRQDFVRNFILNDQVQVIVNEGIRSASANRSRVIAEPRWPSPTEEAQALRSNSRPASPDGVTMPPVIDNGAVARGTTTQPTTPQPTVPPVQPTVPSQSTQQAVPPQSTQPTTGISATPPVESVASISSSASTTEVTPSVPSAPPLFAADVYLKQAKDEFDATRVAAAISLLDQFSQYYPPDSTMLSDELYWLYGQFYEANSPSRNILLSLDYYRRLINEYPQSSRCNDARRRISYLERYFINNR